MSQQSPEVAIDGTLVDAITRVTKRWDRNPDRWDATFDELLDLQVAFENQELSLDEVCWRTRSLLVREGFPVLANRMAQACAQAPASGYAWEPIEVELAPPPPEPEAASAKMMGLKPVQAGLERVAAATSSTIHQVSDQLAEDNGTPMLGLGGVFFALAALVRTIKGL